MYSGGSTISRWFTYLLDLPVELCNFAKLNEGTTDTFKKPSTREARNLHEISHAAFHIYLVTVLELYPRLQICNYKTILIYSSYKQSLYVF